MQENNPISVTPVVTTPVVIEQPKQSNFLVILLSFLLLLSVSIAGFFAFQTQKLVKELTVLKTEEKVTAVATTEPTIEPIATADPTANWKTYTNTDLGFEIKYPSDFKIDEDSGYTTIYKGIKIDSPPIDPFGKSLSISFSSRTSLTSPSAACDEYDSGIVGRCGDYNNRGVKFVKEDLFINNATGVYVKPNDNTSKSYYLMKIGGNKVIEIALWNGDSVFSKSDSEVLDQIISTFKFTN